MHKLDAGQTAIYGGKRYRAISVKNTSGRLNPCSICAMSKVLPNDRITCHTMLGCIGRVRRGFSIVVYKLDTPQMRHLYRRNSKAERRVLWETEG